MVKQVDKTKGNKQKQNQGFQARVCMCIHKACVRSPAIRVRILQVYIRIQAACAHIHTRNPKPRKLEQKAKKTQQKEEN